LKKSIPYRPISGFLLALLFTAGWGLRATHGLLLHSSPTHSICEAAYQQDSNKHIHGSEYAPEKDCPLCAAWFSSVTLLCPAVHLPKAPVFIDTSGLIFLERPDLLRFKDITQRRGPPTV
jgi:hypothetical protein